MNTAPRPSSQTGEVLLSVASVTKRFGGFTALDGVSLTINRGERFGLIGPNGSGKTTLINCISGVLHPDAGRIVFNGQDMSALPAHMRTRRGIARSFQIPRPFKSMTVAENLAVALDFASGRNLDAATRAKAAAEILERMGLADKAATLSAHLSQVELRKMELARSVAAQPRLLISDEAMAGLSGAEIDEVLALLLDLNRDGMTIIMIEHIMHAVMRFSERVVCLDAGRLIAEGTPAQVTAHKRVQEAYLGA